MAGLGLILGLDVLVVGIQDDPAEVDESGAPLVRIYIDARYLHRYVLVDAVEAERVRRAWATCAHLSMPRPPADRIYVATPDITELPS